MGPVAPAPELLLPELLPLELPLELPPELLELPLPPLELLPELLELPLPPLELPPELLELPLPPLELPPELLVLPPELLLPLLELLLPERPPGELPSGVVPTMPAALPVADPLLATLDVDDEPDPPQAVTAPSTTISVATRPILAAISGMDPSSA